MNRLSGGALAIALVFSASAVHAQQPQGLQPENTPEACSDRLDNDGDGFVDCMDPDCQRLALCQAPQGAVPPPPQYPPPGYQQQYPPSGYPPPGYPPPGYPPNYYQPAPVYAIPAPGQLPPPKGIGEVIMGSIFFVTGVAMIGGGVALYDTCHYTTSAFGIGGCSGSDSVDFDASIALLTIGSALTVMGAIFTPVGIVKMARYSRWKREHHMAGINLQPILAATPHAGELGLKLTF